MRAILIGGGALAVETARTLSQQRTQVVMLVESARRVEELEDFLDCGFLVGDATRPALLKEVGPSQGDVLMCLTDNDQNNILASLVGRSIGFEHVITRISGPDLEQLCLELGLTGTIIPDRTTARALADTVHGREPIELSSIMRNGLRFFSFIAGEEEAMAVSALDLPRNTRVVAVHRGDEFWTADGKLEIRPKDQVVLVTHRDQLAALAERWQPTKDLF